MSRIFYSPHIRSSGTSFPVGLTLGHPLGHPLGHHFGLPSGHPVVIAGPHGLPVVGVVDHHHALPSPVRVVHHTPHVFVAPAPVPTPVVSSSCHYNYVAVIVITKGSTGRRQILLANYTTPCAEASVELHRPHHDAPSSRLDRLVQEYGLTGFGVQHTISHTDTSTGERVLCRVVYAPSVSRGRINAAYLLRYSHAKPLVRCYISSHRRGTIDSDYGTLMLSDFNYNIVRAIDAQWSALV